MVEVEYLISLSKEKKLDGLPLINKTAQASLRKIYQKFIPILMFYIHFMIMNALRLLGLMANLQLLKFYMML